MSARSGEISFWQEGVDVKRLVETLRRIDGRSYPAYRDIKGTHAFADFDLDILYTQGDPFASPTRICVRVALDLVGLSPDDMKNPARRVGYEDALLRSFAKAVQRIPSGRRGSGKSGEWGLHWPTQEMLPRTACEIHGEELRILMTVGLPAKGRKVLGRQAREMFEHELQDMVYQGLIEADVAQLHKHADAYEDQEALRAALVDAGWVGFINNGAILPRRSGIDDRPLDAEDVTPWKSPPGLEVTIELPNAGKITGSAFREGVTLICGGGYHGKSTVLRALSNAVYNHIPGDGRDLCSCVDDAVHVRAEDGRAVRGVDISMFISNLPDQRSTEFFLSENASGSTSQAASIAEALEVGSLCLLIDEDTSATNFMVRDRRMQELIPVEQEPITPFVDRIAALYKQLGVSTILVVGGAGDYFEVADTVILMESYRPKLVTEKAHEIAQQHPSGRLSEGRRDVAFPIDRIPVPRGFDASSGRKYERVRARRTDELQFGEEEVDLSLVYQLVDPGQTKAIGDWMLLCARGLADGKRTMRQLCEHIDQMARHTHLSETAERGFGDRVRPRLFELASAINRLRTLEVMGAPDAPKSS